MLPRRQAGGLWIVSSAVTQPLHHEPARERKRLNPVPASRSIGTAQHALPMEHLEEVARNLLPDIVGEGGLEQAPRRPRRFRGSAHPGAPGLAPGPGRVPFVRRDTHALRESARLHDFTPGHKPFICRDSRPEGPPSGSRRLQRQHNMTSEISTEFHAPRAEDPVVGLRNAGGRSAWQDASGRTAARPVPAAGGRATGTARPPPVRPCSRRTAGRRSSATGTPLSPLRLGRRDRDERSRSFDRPVTDHFFALPRRP